MTDHLPECPLHLGCSCPWISPCDDCHCICDRLRACEARVRVNERDWRDQSFGLGYAAGLDAAREAVAYLEENDGAVYDSYQKALAAIDALRGKS